MRLGSLLLAGVVCTALTGCMVGPDFQNPAPPKASSFLPDTPTDLVAGGIPGGDAQKLVQGLDIPGQWWEVFQSRPLNGLIESALRANPDVHAAVAGLKQAQENARAQRATLFPTLQAGLGASQNQTPTSLSPATSTGSTVYGLFTLGLSISYALDIWGGNRRQIESLEALAEAQCFQLEGAYLSLASNVVAAAIQEASLRAQIDATQRIIAAQRETLGILQRQSGLGAIPGGDVATQQAALAQSEATLPPLQKALALQRDLLVTLTGRLPNEDVAAKFRLEDLTLPRDLPLSLPSRLVEQRPDVRAAESNLHSASALVGVATANQLPQITLSTSVNTQSLSTDTLFGPGLMGLSVGASALQTVLDGGALAAKKRAAIAGLEQADAQYRSTVLLAFRNVADTLRSLQYDAITLKASVDAENAAATSLDIAQRRLALGDTTYLTVLIAQLTYQQALLNRVQAQASRLTDTAALFQALGGGWWNRDAGPEEQARRLHCQPPARPAASAKPTVAQAL
ncbi:efflux transporter, outer membrane factor (OMF) lipoprotein, NodT family [Enhydrobacter aerosaccus]|uniref:Efflux transporter, outer membrane factor (OMF) lipoprotein, NodT family n=1 Tax=Enhydrobacter aerosaccus TaxID=225324 RepID=A0A1T4PPY6_9HYPH|nr:efflux transporter outer membrane subunit [Enhydrobacter aerosaccus]SJZ93479.1 efflux transporter, outer membrane factor (OMF) lipoprotein, NodT family [Enhydrobacter aerosaccus]